jgi:hypothetical protein
MPDEDEMERRLWRTMPWDAKTMAPSEEEDAAEERGTTEGDERKK